MLKIIGCTCKIFSISKKLIFNNRKQFLIIALCMFVFACIGVGCSNNPPKIQKPNSTVITNEKTTTLPLVKNEKKITIGVSLLALDNVFISDIESAMQVKAKELGVKLIISDGQNSSEKQISQVENFIAQMVDVIILNPKSMAGCKPAVESANRAGIPILTVNTLVENQDKCATFVGSDAVESGRIQMEYAARLLGGKGNIVLLRGQIGHDAEIGRLKGAWEIIEKTPGIKVLHEQSANWAYSEGLAIMENLLESADKIDAVLSQNDEMALGAIQAIQNANMTGKIMVFGTDAIPEALKAMKLGKMSATVFQDAKAQGVMAIQAAVKVAKGEKVESRIYIPYVLVTKDDLPKYTK